MFFAASTAPLNWPAEKLPLAPKTIPQRLKPFWLGRFRGTDESEPFQNVTHRRVS
jgi:hypothetical protein